MSATNPLVMFTWMGFSSIFFYYWTWDVLVQWLIESTAWTPIHWCGARGCCVTCTTSCSWALQVMAARGWAECRYVDLVAIDQIFCHTCWRRTIEVISLNNCFALDPWATNKLRVPGPLRGANFLFVKIRFWWVFFNPHWLIFALCVLESALKSWTILHELGPSLGMVASPSSS
jgi:hypothetical protein